MSRSKIHFEDLRRRLVRRRQALVRSLHGDLSFLRELHAEPTGDLLDSAANSLQDDLHGQLIEGESREIDSIDSAIARIDAGTYGDCEACGKPIPISRLRAVPFAADCIACCRRREQNESAPGTATDWRRVDWQWSQSISAAG